MPPSLSFQVHLQPALLAGTAVGWVGFSDAVGRVALGLLLESLLLKGTPLFPDT